MDHSKKLLPSDSQSDSEDVHSANEPERVDEESNQLRNLADNLPMDTSQEDEAQRDREKEIDDDGSTIDLNCHEHSDSRSERNTLIENTGGEMEKSSDNRKRKISESFDADETSEKVQKSDCNPAQVVTSEDCVDNSLPPSTQAGHCEPANDSSQSNQSNEQRLECVPPIATVENGTAAPAISNGELDLNENDANQEKCVENRRTVYVVADQESHTDTVMNKSADNQLVEDRTEESRTEVADQNGETINSTSLENLISKYDIFAT